MSFTVFIHGQNFRLHISRYACHSFGLLRTISHVPAEKVGAVMKEGVYECSSRKHNHTYLKLATIASTNFSEFSGIDKIAKFYTHASIFTAVKIQRKYTIITSLVFANCRSGRVGKTVTPSVKSLVPIQLRAFFYCAFFLFSHCCIAK